MSATSFCMPKFKAIAPVWASRHMGKISLSHGFWATVCKTVCRILSVLSVTLVYCGQAVGWIKISLGMMIGLGPGHAVLYGDPAPQKMDLSLIHI